MGVVIARQELALLGQAAMEQADTRHGKWDFVASGGGELPSLAEIQHVQCMLTLALPRVSCSSYALRGLRLALFPLRKVARWTRRAPTRGCWSSCALANWR